MLGLTREHGDWHPIPGVDPGIFDWKGPYFDSENTVETFTPKYFSPPPPVAVARYTFLTPYRVHGFYSSIIYGQSRNGNF